ncbi:hypothetical protein KQI63_10950 [bacterium]|nr:hypothetical protein [bacterium]
MHRMMVVLLGGSSTGGALGSVAQNFLHVGTTSSTIALYAGAMVIGYGLFSTLMFGRPWPTKADK